MIFQQYFLSCLSHASYLIGDETTGRAVVVDPQRDVSGYLDDAAAHGLGIETVIETHFHADFLSGHLELAAATGAEICFGAGAQAEFPIRWLADGERIVLGGVCLQVVATPGHTPESISIVVYEHESDEIPYGVLTGDALFVGDVGRPDLLSAAGVPAEEMAAQLYHSLHDRLFQLPDDTRVFPAHGAGSSCGKNLSDATSSTIGEQRRTNVAVALPTEGAFVAAVTQGQPVAPAYFPYDAHLNHERRELLDDHAPPPPLSLSNVLARMAGGAVVLDTRDPDDFARSHLSGAVNVGLGGRFAEFAGDVLRPFDEIVLVCDPGHATEARVRLGRIGFDAVVGSFAAGGPDPFAAAPQATGGSRRIAAGELGLLLEQSGHAITVLDVRNPAELEEGCLPGAVNIALSQLTARLDSIALDRPVVVYCASGYRSSIAASVLCRHGHAEVIELLGGYQAWDDTTRAHRVGARPG